MDDLSQEEKSVLLRELREAIASGALMIRFREREVKYRSLSEMKQIKADLERDISGRPKRRVILTTFDRGI